MKNSLNSEIQVKFKDQLATGSPVVFFKEDSKGGNVALYLAQDVKLESNITEESSLSLLAFVGQRGSVRSCTRAIVVVPKGSAYDVPVGTTLTNATIKIWRSTDAFKDKASSEGKYPSQAVLNTTNGKIAGRDGQPMFEHKLVIGAVGGKEYEWNLAVPGEQNVMDPADVAEYLESLGVPTERAEVAAQTSFNFEVVPQEDMTA